MCSNLPHSQAASTARSASALQLQQAAVCTAKGGPCRPACRLFIAVHSKGAGQPASSTVSANPSLLTVRPDPNKPGSKFHEASMSVHCGSGKHGSKPPCRPSHRCSAGTPPMQLGPSRQGPSSLLLACFHSATCSRPSCDIAKSYPPHWNTIHHGILVKIFDYCSCFASSLDRLLHCSLGVHCQVIHW